MKVEIEADVIAKVRDALQIIMGNAEIILPIALPTSNIRAHKIIEQVKRFGNLLPHVSFEGG